MGGAHGGVAGLVSIVGQNIDVGFIPSVIRIFFLGKPPGMFGTHDPRVHAGKKFGPLPDLATRRFNDNPVSLIDAFFFCGLGMDFHSRFPVQFTQPGYLSVFGMEKARQPPAGNQNIRIFFEKFRGTVRAFRRFAVLR